MLFCIYQPDLLIQEERFSPHFPIYMNFHSIPESQKEAALRAAAAGKYRRYDFWKESVETSRNIL